MTQFLHLYPGSENTGCLASFRLGAVLNSSSHDKAVVGGTVIFVVWEWVQPPSEMRALARLKQHGRAWWEGGRAQREGRRKVQRCGGLGRERCHDTPMTGAGRAV